MKRRIMQVLGVFGTIAVSATPLRAHPSTSLHVHSGEVAGLVVVSLIVLGILALASKPER